MDEFYISRPSGHNTAHPHCTTLDNIAAISHDMISNETTNWYQFVQFVQIYTNYHTNPYQSVNIIPICMIKAANLFLVRKIYTK